MRLYRSIGENELKTLLKKCPVVGKYHCSTEMQNTCGLQNAVCFFVDEFHWSDTNHKFVVVVDIPNTLLEFGVGTYYAPKSLKNTKVWTGRTGEYVYGIREAYIDSYSLSDVVEIYLFNYYNISTSKQIKEICDENNVTFLNGDGVLEPVHQFNTDECRFTEDPYKEFDFISEKFLSNRENIVSLTKDELDNQKLLRETRTKIMDIFRKGDTEAIELAKKIKDIL